MEAHRLAEARSLAMHRAIADKLASDPSILPKARERVDRWYREEPNAFCAVQWKRILNDDRRSIAAFLVEDSDLARELRQSTPFAGALEARERWQIWRRVGEAARQANDS